MDRTGLLKCIAETGYNVGFGAKKHFATYDIVVKAPGLISFVAIAMGIYGLIWEVLAGKFFAGTLAVIGVIGVYILNYDERKADYEHIGNEMTRLFNRLRDLYRKAKVCSESELPDCASQLTAIENEFYPLAISKQIMFADLWAHYKFFWQQQIDWVDEQKSFTLLRDKLPLSFTVMVILVALGLTGATVWMWRDVYCR